MTTKMSKEAYRMSGVRQIISKAAKKPPPAHPLGQSLKEQLREDQVAMFQEYERTCVSEADRSGCLSRTV
jgi:hypothetical protein